MSYFESEDEDRYDLNRRFIKHEYTFNNNYYYTFEKEFNDHLREIIDDESFKPFHRAIAKLLITFNLDIPTNKAFVLRKTKELLQKMIKDNNCDCFEDVIDYILNFGEITSNCVKTIDYIKAFCYPEYLKDEHFYNLMLQIHCQSIRKSDNDEYNNPVVKMLQSYHNFCFTMIHDNEKKEMLDSYFFLELCSDVISYIHRTKAYGDDITSLFNYIGENIEDYRTYCKLNVSYFDNDFEFRKHLASMIVNKFRNPNTNQKVIK